MAPATKLKIAKGALYEWTKEKPIRVKKKKHGYCKVAAHLHRYTLAR